METDEEDEIISRNTIELASDLDDCEDIRLLLETTLESRRDLEFLKEGIVRHPSVFHDAPQYLRQSFDFALLAFGNAKRATAQCLVNELHRASSPSMSLKTFQGEVQQRLVTHASFTEAFLPALTLPTESPLLSRLDQGQAISMVLKILIAKFSGDPTITFDELRLHRRALENPEGTLDLPVVIE